MSKLLVVQKHGSKYYVEYSLNTETNQTPWYAGKILDYETIQNLIDKGEVSVWFKKERKNQ